MLYLRRSAGTPAAVALALALIRLRSDLVHGKPPNRHIASASREIAIRSAIGAQPADTFPSPAWASGQTILAGLIVGEFGSASLPRVLTGILYQVNARDPLTLASAAVLLAIGALAACVMPARRALQLDPMVILRSE
jgi:ABC-type lipoprotein release transport system permease subunit